MSLLLINCDSPLPLILLLFVSMPIMSFWHLIFPHLQSLFLVREKLLLLNVPIQTFYCLSNTTCITTYLLLECLSLFFLFRFILFGQFTGKSFLFFQLNEWIDQKGKTTYCLSKSGNNVLLACISTPGKISKVAKIVKPLFCEKKLFPASLNKLLP